MKKAYAEPLVEIVEAKLSGDILLGSDVDINVGGLYDDNLLK